MIAFRCPCCKILNEAPEEHAGRETYCLKCLKWYRIPMQSEAGTQGQDVPHSPYIGDNPFDEYSEHYGPDTRRCYEYHVFISYANVEPDRTLARELASRCVNARWRTFFAPESLRLENLHQEAFQSRWCDLLEKGLLSSCHLLGLLTPAHLASAYCDLEIQGFLRVVSSNPARGIVLVLNGISNADVPASLQPFVCDGEYAAIERRLSELIASSALQLGRACYTPATLFDPLPTSSDVWRFGFGPDSARERIFQLYVREYMVLILKGLDPMQVSLNWPMLATDEYKAEALAKAKELIGAGVLPYPTADRNWRSQPSPQPMPRGTAQKTGTGSTRTDAPPSISANPLDPSRTYERPSKWFDILDYGGRGYPQDMDFVCRTCGYHEGVGNPNEPPTACPKCAVTK